MLYVTVFGEKENFVFTTQTYNQSKICLPELDSFRKFSSTMNFAGNMSSEQVQV